MTAIVDELTWRGLIAHATDEDALRKALADGPVTFYCGFDPTAASLHVGHLVQVLTLRRLQQAGHRPLALVGGATGHIGDPRPTAERTLNDPETIAEWVTRLRAQIEPYLSFEGDNAATMVNNLDWTGGMTVIEFLRDIGKHFRVNKMLTKDSVAQRLASDQGISFTEFSYQLLQGMDFLELYRRYGCTLQTGGSDQWGNLTAGLDLIHRLEPHAEVHALATPLMTKADGTKFGKTETGTLWLDPEMTTPYAFYQFWLNTDDRDISRYMRILSFKSREELEELEKVTEERPQARTAQRALAEELTTLVHGADECAAVIAASKALFGQGELTELDEATLAAAISELPNAKVSELGQVTDMFAEVGLAPSKSAARRTVKEGGAYVNNVKVTAEDAVVAADELLHGRWLVLRRGKKNLAAIEVTGA
ncbi:MULTISPECIES: tyrosine--tRNA ligase [Streptomyces violaceusniger group]|uniref:Tyrosine--tRNA ligase n=3 Tax=Streptomyces violaceusniger group TaxID=2839105 RepID=A0A0A0NU32_STRRN|nr:tyrosine--tRNA ligase [Streptomyces rapamycinicus]AGP58290.1 tyrosyl-tRNA synthetase [Streptomyces rapamycinicus NRRL 5491]MBB4785980.1 tyrosyl-tRNA synthetase [Streptomyces rapamycinicus]RLV78558.1 tyrosyl-tRNA synthetase [Streptomyces rapamycinicus NRRL 5491]UTO66106.1 tyrosine--tRNA ligase [Streptomyces rapamycinicus]UTP34060.1 tyrosine--tRNA ligase [Streptomyces rapamycinicus NRRL 5491]